AARAPGRCFSRLSCLLQKLLCVASVLLRFLYFCIRFFLDQLQTLRARTRLTERSLRVLQRDLCVSDLPPPNLFQPFYIRRRLPRRSNRFRFFVIVERTRARHQRRERIETRRIQILSQPSGCW